MKRRGNAGLGGLAAIACLLGLVLFFFMYVMPKYRVWAQGMEGEAELEKAKQTKQIMLEQARAEKESAELKAEAIRIVGQAAKEFPEYRKQEFIAAFAEAMSNGNIQKIIYVPTEANIPIIDVKE